MRTANDEFRLLRKRPTTTEDRVVATGSKAEMLRHFESVPDTHRPQYRMMQGSAIWSHTDLEEMVRLEK
jgi:hypothetical protein